MASTRFLTFAKHLIRLNTLQIRFAGHAKWQNIRTTKLTNDLQKSKICSRYVLLTRRAILQNNRVCDPKLNTALANVMNEAMRANVPKATLERAIERARNLKIQPLQLEVQGPGGCSLILKCETDQCTTLKKDIRKLLKKLDSHLLSDNAVIGMFKQQGIIRTDTKTTDGKEISLDQAEEAAIIANIEEVKLEQVEGDELSKTYVFYTESDVVNNCKGELEKHNFKILTCDTELIPYRKIEFDETTTEKIAEVIKALRENPEVIDVYSNVEHV